MTLLTDRITLNEERNVILTAMRQSVGGEFGQISKRPAILILPGGGYSMCSDREAEVIAYPYLQAGYHAFVLRYSIGEHRAWPNPLNDYEQAMELVRSNEENWNILPDKIAVIGFSAGGHLAGCAATMAKNRPNAVILGYAALERDIAEACQPNVNIPSPTDYVDGRTPPCFLFAARDDVVVPLCNTLNFESALLEYDVQFESHIYAYGGHGFGTADPAVGGADLCRRVPNWVRDSIGWLEDVFGQLTPSGLSAPVCLSKINGNQEKFLSVDCTLSYLGKREDVRMLIQTILVAVDAIIENQFGSSALAADVLGEFKLCEILKVLGKNDAEIETLDVVLRQMPNLQEPIS